MDGPVIGEERIHDRAETLTGVLVVEGDRLIGAVAAGHHERPPVGAEQG
jgi:hypothetical protein